MDSVDKKTRKNAKNFEINDNIGPCILETAPRGYRKMTAHTIFDVKLDAGFTRKERLVTYGHKVDTTPSMKYGSVLSRYIVKMLLLLAALNGFDVQFSGVQNTYLNTNPEEHVYF